VEMEIISVASGKTVERLRAEGKETLVWRFFCPCRKPKVSGQGEERQSRVQLIVVTFSK